MLAAVDMRIESYAFVGDLSYARKRKHLKSAAVGQNRFIPRHEFMQSARFFDEFVSGTHV